MNPMNPTSTTPTTTTRTLGSPRTRGRRVALAAVALAAAAGSSFAVASPASASSTQDVINAVVGGSSVGGTNKGYTTPKIYSAPTWVGCNQSAGQLAINMVPGNQGVFTAYVWTQTWTSAGWGSFVYRGKYSQADNWTSPATVAVGHGTFATWVQVVYPAGTSYNGYVRASKYATPGYGYSLSGTYNGTCNV